MSSSVLPDLPGLVALARQHRLDLRPVILRVQTDLLAAARVRDPAAWRSFETMAAGLLPGIDDETAAIVARKLAPLPDAPERLLCLLVARGGTAQRAVIELAPRLTP